MRLSKKYSLQLGMEVSNALRLLARKILLDMATRLGEHFCCRCGEPIEDVRELSLDHQQNWINQPNAEELFWSLKNVRLAHVKCNVKEAAERKRISKEDKRAGGARRSQSYRERHLALDPEGFRARMAAHQRACTERKKRQDTSQKMG